MNLTPYLDKQSRHSLVRVKTKDRIYVGRIVQARPDSPLARIAIGTTKVVLHAADVESAEYVALGTPMSVEDR